MGAEKPSFFICILGFHRLQLLFPNLMQASHWNTQTFTHTPGICHPRVCNRKFFFAHMFGIHQLKPCCVPHLPALLVAKSLVIRHEVFIETQRPTGTCNYTSKKLCTRVVSAESRVKTLCHPLFDGNAFLELGMPPGLRSFFFPLPQFIYLRYRKFNSGNNL